MIFLFWLCFVLIGYTYAGYPVLLYLARRLYSQKIHKGHYEPAVSVLISAYNEEKAIEKKLINLLNMDYPEDKLEILIGSDGAHDNTDQIISKFRSPRIRFFRYVENLGKASVLNSLVNEAKGSILVFTDARQEFDRKAVRQLVENFYDNTIGCVSGELHFRDVKTGVSQGMNAYWRYEKFLRKGESAIGSTLGATGAIYAVRRRLFSPLPKDIVVDDMYIPLAIVSKGYRSVFEPEAMAYDQPSQEGTQEMKRKVRTLTGNYQIIQYLPELLNPFRSPVSFQLFSHKLMRLIVPFLLILTFAVNAFIIDPWFYRGFMIAQILFYSLALSERIFRKKGIGYIPYTFVLLNYSAFLAFFRYFSKKQKGVWEKAYV